MHDAVLGLRKFCPEQFEELGQGVTVCHCIKIDEVTPRSAAGKCVNLHASDIALVRYSDVIQQLERKQHWITVTEKAYFVPLNVRVQSVRLFSDQRESA